MSPFYTAYEAGYFSNAGFNLQLTKELPNVQSIPLLAAGKLDVGFPGLTTGLMNAVERGARVRIVAGRVVVSSSCEPHAGIYVRSSEFPDGVRNMRQLRRRRIAVPNSTTFGLFCLDKLLEREGMSRADVEIHETSANERLAALRAGAVDAFLTLETDMNTTIRSLQLASGPRLGDVLPNVQYGFIAFGSRLLDGDVRTGASFLGAYFRGVRDFQAGKTPAFMDEFAKTNKLDPALVKAACRDSFEHDGRIHFRDMQTYADWAVDQGYIGRPIRAQDLVDTRFLDALQRVPA